MPTVILGPTGTLESARWLPRTLEQDWNTIEVPTYDHQPGRRFNLDGNSTFIDRARVRIAGDTVHYRVGTAVLDGRPVDASAEEITEAMIAGAVLTPGQARHYTAPLRACKFWKLEQHLYGRDN